MEEKKVGKKEVLDTTYIVVAEHDARLRGEETCGKHSAVPWRTEPHIQHGWLVYIRSENFDRE